MASSNRHWPSMFKSKPCNTHHQWQHDINSSLMSTGCHRSPYTSGCEERSPDPKPRWNPKPEQIRILEAIFNSGMVNPPRDEIRKIRAQLQEYGQVGDANVFYWFQNRKSRSKHKLRHLQNSKNQGQQIQTSNISSSSSPKVASRSTPTAVAPCSSSSSSEKSSPKTAPAPSKKFSVGFSRIAESTSNSPTASVNRASYLSSYSEAGLPVEPFFPMQLTGGMVQHSGRGAAGTENLTQGLCFPELSNVVQVPQHIVGPCTSLLLSEIMNQGASKKGDQEERTMKLHPPNQLSFSVPTTTSPHSHVSAISSSSITIPSYISHIGGVGEPTCVGQSNPNPSSTKSTVFINDVAFDVPAGPFNVREAFGVDSVLIHSSGQPVLTNEWGLTLESLQHGASYYLVPA